jgi:Apc15p protein
MRDEVAIEHRKNNVRRFGAHWIRPPGVVKTLQAKLEEEQERREAAEQMRREAAMQEMVEAQNEAAARTAAQETEAGEPDAEMERDLDADVPEAEEEDADDEDDEDDDDDEDEDDEDLEEDEDEDEDDENPSAPAARNANRRSTFNEDNLLHGSFVGGDEELAPGSTQHFLDAEDAELDGRAQDMRDFGFIERDLDDDVPEAEGWEHTDSEAEDSSEMEEDNVEQTPRDQTVEMDIESSFHSITRRRSRGRGRYSGGPEPLVQPALRSSFGAAEETSQVGASPRDGGWLMRRLRGARRGRT